jgi:hypothetical protein
MTLKLALVMTNSYYFCGKVALSIKNTVSNPASISFESLSSDEVVGLVRAIKTNVIKAVEGEDVLLSKFKEINDKRKSKKETTEVEKVTEEVKEAEVVVEAIEEVQEEKTSEKEESNVEVEIEKEVEVTEEVKEESTVKVKPVAKRTTTVKKTVAK